MAEPALSPEELRTLATAGGAAPSLHNSQPWRFCPKPDGSGILVYCEPKRAVPLTDPFGRALHVSVGAAVFNLRVAAHHLGRFPAARLVPNRDEPRLLAEIDLTAASGTPAPFGHDLFPAIAARHSCRQPFTNRDVPETDLGELIAAAREEGALLTALEEAGVRRVLAVTAEAESRTHADLAREAETRHWLRLEEPATDGIPEAAMGPQDHDARVPMRSFHASAPAVPALATQRFEALPQVCTVSTDGDLPVDWLRAGQALERVWLLATVQGLRLSVLHQAVEWPDTRWRLRDPDGPLGHVQMLLRLGFGPPGPATPRRPVQDVLDLRGYPGAGAQRAS
ncbi:nitroreductase family protein [Streptacidiphilus sp. EB129]|uniref:Acg family FMN-binding oxidoreductase n=1 Tax=Streptacidiphilus sp. EB129 TaxID=3156262 RepID=UPI003515F885